MKRKCLIILLSALWALLLIMVNDRETAAAQPQPDQYQTYVRFGIEKALNLEFQNAHIQLQKAVEMTPENPTGYAYLAIINLFAYEMSFDEKTRRKNQEAMLLYVDETLTRGDKRIENTKDSQAYFAMAMAKIAKVNWALHQKHYFIMASETSKIWDYLEKAREGDPQNYDIYFLMGLFHYHIDHLPGLTRFLSSLMITSGDTQKGLQELELAAQKGDFLKQLARAELSSNYLNFEKQPARALPLIRDLKEKFPNNYNYSFSLGNALADLGRFDEAFQIAREVEKKIQAGISPFVPQLQPRYYQLMGRIFFGQGEYEQAAQYFRKTLTDTSPYNARVRARAFVWLGMISDARGERDKAQEYYSQALDVEGGEGTAQIDAKKYLKNSYTVPPKN
jgi:tetratricopeptide (TPR) repeat protein